MPEQTFQKRQIAYKVKISDLLNGNFTKEEFSAGYIKINGNNVSRVNIISTMVYKSEENYTSSIIDDGTGRILLRSFENTSLFSKVDVGDPVLVIGRIREFNNEKYIIPEILKKISNAAWINTRKLELSKSSIINENIEPTGERQNEEISSNISEQIYLLIKDLDNGDGVAVEDILKNFDNHEAENIITKLLESGNLFEIKPGKLKVLE